MTGLRHRHGDGARLLAELQYEPFPDISRAIPALVQGFENVVLVNLCGAK